MDDLMGDSIERAISDFSLQLMLDEAAAEWRGQTQPCTMYKPLNP